jgi:hypothetical protein
MYRKDGALLPCPIRLHGVVPRWSTKATLPHIETMGKMKNAVFWGVAAGVTEKCEGG